MKEIRNSQSVIDQLIRSDSYFSPSLKPGLAEWLLRDNWFYFILKYLGIVFKTRKQALAGAYDYREWAESSIDILRLLEKVGGQFAITGMNYISSHSGPVVFVSNHMSTLETMIFPGIIAPRRKTTFVVKESLVRHPLFGPVMRSRNPIVVNRTDARKDFERVMDRGPELLSADISVIIFPQSTRREIFKPEEFNTLGVKLAKKAGVPVIPVAIKTDFWGNGKIIKEFGKLDHKKIIHMRFGKPFFIEGNGKEENQTIIRFIEDSLKEWE
ncbi:MAG TPA: lysophospholipid acyltransferase family protein [Bacteroidales bacterium]|nr:lysophospholipid acyltransferase family protein [Bacteroidales bacterium]